MMKTNDSSVGNVTLTELMLEQQHTHTHTHAHTHLANKTPQTEKLTGVTSAPGSFSDLIMKT